MVPPVRIDHANMSPRLNPKNFPILLAEAHIVVVIVPGLIHFQLPVELKCARGVSVSAPVAQRQSTMLVRSVTESATGCMVVP